MKTKERIKTLLLAVLLFGAFFFTYLIWNSYMGTTDSDDGEFGLSGSTVSLRGAGNVVPFSISFKNQRGRFGAAYHAGSVKGVYEAITPILEEGLEQVSVGASCSDEDWAEAIVKKGVLIDYEGSAPLFVIAKTHGINMRDNGIYCRYLFVGEGAMYVKDAKGKCYRFKTSLTDEYLEDVLSTLSGAPCILALEGNSTRANGETPVFNGNISSFTVNSINTIESFTDQHFVALLKIFGMNYNTCGKHTEQDGSRVFIEGLNTLKIAPDGYITYESKGEDDDLGLTIPAEGDVPTTAELIDGAGGIMQSLSALSGGDATLYLREISDGNTVKYGRSFGGIPIDRSGSGYSGEIYFRGKKVERVGFYMRAYVSSGAVVQALPQKLAIAAIPGNTFGVISLRYTDTGSGMDAQWYVKK